MATFPERLRQLREENGMSIRQLAQKLYLCHETIYRFENAISSPKSDVIIDYCRLFGVSADWLLGLSDVRHAEADAIAPRLEQVYAALFDIRKLAQDAITTVKEA